MIREGNVVPFAVTCDLLASNWLQHGLSFDKGEGRGLHSNNLIDPSRATAAIVSFPLCQTAQRYFTFAF